MPNDSVAPTGKSETRREEEFVGEELHDTVCQTMAGVSLMLSSLTKRRERGKELALEDLEKIRANVDVASEQLRLIFEATLLERYPQKLLSMLERLATSTALRVSCCFSADDSIPVLDGTTAYAFYRAARIFIHIAIRAGGADKIRMRLTMDKEKPRLHLSFDGAPVLSPAFSTSDEKLLGDVMGSGSFQWGIESGTVLVCGPLELRSEG